MLPNITYFLQPINQRVIATFEAYYIRNTFIEIIRILDTSDKTIKGYRRSGGVRHQVGLG